MKQYTAVTNFAGSVDLSRFHSITAQHEAPVLSKKYRHIPTMEMVNLLAKDNWAPVMASEVNSRAAGKIGYQKHIIRFRNHDLTIPTGSDRLYPEIVMTNSHDGSTAYTLMAGLFRVVCGNGLVVADSTFCNFKIKHVGFESSQVGKAVESVMASLPRIASKVEQFQSIELTRDEAEVFAAAAMTVRYDEEQLAKVPVMTSSLLLPTRRADGDSTLWNTFNIIQEKFIKGARILEPRETWKRNGKSRAIKSIDENIRINKALWMLTEKMAQLKAGAAA